MNVTQFKNNCIEKKNFEEVEKLVTITEDWHKKRKILYGEIRDRAKMVIYIAGGCINRGHSKRSRL